MKTVELKYNEWLNENYDTEMIESFGDKDLRDGFYAGYLLAQKELEEQIAYEKSQLEICGYYCEVYTEDIKNLNTIIAEAIKVIEVMKDDLLHEGMIKYEGYLMAEAYLEKWK